jgi:hypothetical protein
MSGTYEPTAAELEYVENMDFWRRYQLARSYDDIDGGGPFLGERPKRNPVAFDPNEYREGIARRYREAVERDGITAFSDDPGAGKTTTVGIEAAASGEPHALLFAMHAKARDYVTDDATPPADEYLELRGGSQPRHDGCMDALAKARLDADRSTGDASCEEHGDADEWPLMCPAYRLDKDNPVRRRFDALRGLVGAGEAHAILGDDLHEGRCEWQRRQARIPNADRIVGVHEHQTLRSVRENNRIITDETPRELKETTRVTSTAVERAANALRKIPERGADELADFCDRLRAAIAAGECVENVEAPAIEWRTDERYPFDAMQPGETGIADVEPRVRVRKAGTLAAIKVAYNERVRADLRRLGAKRAGDR